MFNDDINEEWITDKIRIFYDGIDRYRSGDKALIRIGNTPFFYEKKEKKLLFNLVGYYFGQNNKPNGKSKKMLQISQKKLISWLSL